MISDLALARVAFAESTSSAEALLGVARLRLEVEAVRAEAADQAENAGIAAPEVSVQLTTPADHVDKTA